MEKKEKKTPEKILPYSNTCTGSSQPDRWPWPDPTPHGGGDAS